MVEWSIATIYDANLIVQTLQLSLTRHSPQAVLLHHSGRMSTDIGREDVKVSIMISNENVVQEGDYKNYAI